MTAAPNEPGELRASAPAAPRQAGFTLIEVLIAVALLALAMAVLSSGVISNLNAARDNRALAGASAIAQNILEGYRRTWADPAAYAAGSEPDLSDLPPLPPPYNEVSPLVTFSVVAVNDTAGVAIPNRLNPGNPGGVPRVKQVEVLIYKRSAEAFRVSTRISDPTQLSGGTP